MCATTTARKLSTIAVCPNPERDNAHEDKRGARHKVAENHLVVLWFGTQCAKPREAVDASVGRGTEGFDTADLKEAKALLEELG
jgi:hypothetical protein